MAKTWFRVHSDGPSSILDNVKVIDLTDKLFRWLILLWCCASRNDGVLPSTRHISLWTHRPERDVAKAIQELVAKRFIDVSGDCYTVHNWNEHQFHSDSSTERVRKFRERSTDVSVKQTGNVSHETQCNNHETPSRADARYESVSVSDSVSVSSVSDSVEEYSPETVTPPTNGKSASPNYFGQFWEVVWAKIGKEAAHKAWLRQVHNTEQAQRVIAAAKVQGPLILESARVGQHSVLHPASWLNGGRFDDDISHLEKDLANYKTNGKPMRNPPIETPHWTPEPDPTPEERAALQRKADAYMAKINNLPKFRNQQ